MVFAAALQSQAIVVQFEFSATLLKPGRHLVSALLGEMLRAIQWLSKTTPETSQTIIPV